MIETTRAGETPGAAGEVLGVTSEILDFVAASASRSFTLNAAAESVVTTRILWLGAALLVALDVCVLPWVVHLIPRSRFVTLKSAVMISALAIWAGIWLVVVSLYWKPVYSFFFPDWSRWLLPLAFGAFFAVCARFLWLSAVRVRVHPVVAFVGLGSLLGPTTHLLAVWRGIVEVPPMLKGASPVAAIVVSAPEFAFYWCIVLLAAVFVRWSWAEWSGSRPGPGPLT